MLPRPESFAYEGGGKLIIKTSGGKGKDGERRKFSFPSTPARASRSLPSSPCLQM